MIVSRRTLAFLFVLLASLATGGGLSAQRPVITIGTVADGPQSSTSRRAGELVEREISQILRSEYEVRFPDDKKLVGNWTPESVRDHIDSLIADPDVDHVIALGVLSSNEAAARKAPPKPLLSMYVLFPEIQDLPYVERQRVRPGAGPTTVYHVSGEPNISYTAAGTEIRDEIRMFQRITPFKRVTLLAMEAFVSSIPRLEQKVDDAATDLDLEIAVVEVGESLEAALAEISSRTEAVYVTPLLHLTEAQFQRLTDFLIERRLPSFSLRGRYEVELGLLAGLQLEEEFDRVARRTALNLHRILMGERPEDIPVDFDKRQRLTINMAVARQIQVYPSWALLTDAELINQSRETAGRRLSLATVVREAEQANLDLAAADRTVSAGRQLVRESKAPLKPQIEISGLQAFIDKDRAQSSFGSVGQSQTSGSAAVSQIIYSEPTRAGYDIEQELQATRELDRAELRLDVILEAAQSYLDVLSTKTGERIQRENLELTRQNLERAQSRVELGAAGPGEALRWETQIANNRRDLIDVNASRNLSEIALNRVLNRPSEEPFLTEEVGLDDAELTTSYEQLRPYLDSLPAGRIFRNFMTQEAFEASPELARLDAAIRAQERSLLASKRIFYLPTVAAQADVRGFKNAGAGSMPPELPDIPGFSFTRTNNLDWTIGLSASLPIFNGGGLRAQRARAEIEIDEITVQREAVRQRIEQRTRSALHRAGASWAGIDLSREAARASAANLDIVADAYAEGTVDIIRLLDAQNQALVADLVAATAVYQFLQDLMEMQRASGRFDYFRSPDDAQAFLDRMDAFYQQAGFPVRKQN